MAARQSVDLTDAATSTLRKQRAEQKIDAAVALLMVLGRAMAVGLDAMNFAGLLADPIVV